MKGWMLAAALAAVAPLALAQDEDRRQLILDQQALLQTELRAGVRRLSEADIEEIAAQQRIVRRLLEAHASPDEMKQHERVELDNALQEINARVVGSRVADEDRRVCKLERSTGTNVRKQTCHTRAEWATIRKDARTWMATPRICIPPGCGEAPGDRIRLPTR